MSDLAIAIFAGIGMAFVFALIGLAVFNTLIERHRIGMARKAWVVRQAKQAWGGIAIRCPECGAELPVPVAARIEDSQLVVDPDLTDVWAHAWTHKGGADE